MPTTAADPRHLYLDLMKQVLTNGIYGDGAQHQELQGGPRRRAWKRLKAWWGFTPPDTPFDSTRRAEGRDWPSVAHTMIGLARLDNLQECLEQVIAEDVPGDCIETGVWRGGASIFMRAVLKAHDITDRTVWLADSFAGLPAPDGTRYPRDAGSRLHECSQLAVSMADVQANFDRYGLLDGQVRFLKGWFRDTLPQAPIESLSLLRLDGDMYQSTWDALEALYPRLSVGGFVIVDDYGALPACAQAVEDYREQHGIRDAIIPIDWSGVYWRRTEAGGGD